MNPAEARSVTTLAGIAEASAAATASHAARVAELIAQAEPEPEPGGDSAELTAELRLLRAAVATLEGIATTLALKQRRTSRAAVSE